MYIYQYYVTYLLFHHIQILYSTTLIPNVCLSDVDRLHGHVSVIDHFHLLWCNVFIPHALSTLRLPIDPIPCQRHWGYRNSYKSMQSYKLMEDGPRES